MSICTTESSGSQTMRRFTFARASHDNLVCAKTSRFYSVKKSLNLNFLLISSKTHDQLHFYKNDINALL